MKACGLWLAKIGITMVTSSVKIGQLVQSLKEDAHGMVTSQNYFSVSLKEKERFRFVMWRPDLWFAGTTWNILAANSFTDVLRAKISNDRTFKPSGVLRRVDMWVQTFREILVSLTSLSKSPISSPLAMGGLTWNMKALRSFETSVFTCRNGVTSQKTWIFNKTTKRTAHMSNHLKIAL